MIHTIKGFSIVNEAEVDIFLEFLSSFYDTANVGGLVSVSSAFSKPSFSVHIQLKPNLKNFEYFFTSMWNECNCMVVGIFFCIALLWDWNENWPFPVLWPLLRFQICWHIVCSTLTASSFMIWNSSAGIPSPMLTLFVVMLPKAHLTSHSRMSGTGWVTTPSWLSGSLRLFLYSSSVYSLPPLS